jgi:hypothetical protein
MFFRTFRRFLSASINKPTPGQGVEFFSFVLNKDNLKFTGAILAAGTVLTEISYVSYKVFKIDDEIRKLEESILTKVESKFDKVESKFDKMDSKFEAKFDNIDKQFIGLRQDIMSILAITAIRKIPVETAEELAKIEDKNKSDKADKE